MANAKRDLLEVLKLELEFLRNGGYRQASSWMPKFIFEDSPTCLNYGDPQHAKPCSECVLLQLVPMEHRAERVPCRHIPLNAENETIQSLYVSGTSQELESRVAEWLMNTIQRLEIDRAGGQSGGVDPRPKGRVGAA